MAGQKDQLTLKQDQFARLVAEQGLSFVAGYRLAYPPRNGKRSPVAERVAARRVAHHPLVERRMEELRKQLRAGDPAELRRRANAVLGRILAQELDPKYRRTALDVLRYLDNQERGVEKAQREALRTAMAQLALCDAIDGRGRRGCSPAARRQPIEVPEAATTADAGDEHPTEASRVTPTTEADAERRREIDEVIAARRRMRFGGRM